MAHTITVTADELKANTYKNQISAYTSDGKQIGIKTKKINTGTIVEIGGIYISDNAN